MPDAHLVQQDEEVQIMTGQHLCDENGVEMLKFSDACQGDCSRHFQVTWEQHSAFIVGNEPRVWPAARICNDASDIGSQSAKVWPRHPRPFYFLGNSLLQFS